MKTPHVMKTDEIIFKVLIIELLRVSFDFPTCISIQKLVYAIWRNMNIEVTTSLTL